MKAMLCEAYGPPEDMRLTDIPPLKAGPGQVVISVKACGVNFPDALMIQDKYQFKSALPFAPGGEVAGIVKEAGDGVHNLKAGDRVAATIRSGGFAEEALAEAQRCIHVPKSVDYDVASSFIVTYGTSYHALKDRAHLKSGEKLVVLGAAGGVGIAAVELGALMGAHVIAGASTPEKVAFAKAHGAIDGFVYPPVPLSKDQQKALSEEIKRLTGGEGADVLYDPVGDDYAEPALRAMAWQGRYLVIGFAAGAIPRVPLNLALLKGCDIVGVFWGVATARNPKGAFADLEQLARWIAEGKLKPQVSETFSLQHAGRAIRMLMDRKALGKVVVTME
ncbi:MAG: NADPH:quinone oxidoreductase family protein [Alphaproteobacteria bacterium]|nr:NADPH:quinone oxidoreductase family protein [Alphaproteobacteria bacterium]MDE1987568.1 NADPH:quinone oxidoreductase family protein [Alphaproteobacteria bacterium]MDE2162152.1 NADPH:quinone oxidoreductase family protein [Alphaproteobacteria bacterium]MDE2500745.1 NADPH:quinone oxidoreductase family protein [Alphaproteobacteria bacterium]